PRGRQAQALEYDPRVHQPCSDGAGHQAQDLQQLQSRRGEARSRSRCAEEVRPIGPPPRDPRRKEGGVQDREPCQVLCGDRPGHDRSPDRLVQHPLGRVCREPPVQDLSQRRVRDALPNASGHSFRPPTGQVAASGTQA
ncbi:hypothetical protein ABG067_008145, partial [Albugo candida]